MESSLIKLNYWKDVWWIVALPTINNSSKWTCLRKSIVWKRCSSFSYTLSQKENLVFPLEKRRNFEFSKITLPKRIFFRMMENNWTNNWISNGDWVMFCTFSFLLKIVVELWLSYGEKWIDFDFNWWQFDGILFVCLQSRFRSLINNILIRTRK